MIYKDFPNIGFLCDIVPKNVIASLRTEIKQMDLENAESQDTYLGNNFQNVYTLTESNNIVESYILNICNSYNEAWPMYESGVLSTFKKNFDLYLSELWVNLQEKNQFNPSHKHTGLYSFVIWLDLPSEDELRQTAGKFEFNYTNSLGEILNYQIPLDKTFEGKVLFFPAKMNHSVYPFYQNNFTRITVSGNINLKEKG